MKKTDIKEGVTYQTKDGSAARRVVGITSDRDLLPMMEGCKSPPEGQEGPWVVYVQKRGAGKGKEDALQLASFASWAHSEDA